MLLVLGILRWCWWTGKMKGKKYTPEQIVAKLWGRSSSSGKGMVLGEVCRQLEITDVTNYWWRKEYGGLQVDQGLSGWGRP